jgi:protein-tyrosine phosphatase
MAGDGYRGKWKASGVIDLHCHILPGIDDGALDLTDSVEMARQAEADGIELICATPHIRHDHDVRIGELEWRTEEVNAELERALIAARVAPGGEVAETILDHVDDDELRTVSLGGGGGWILLEPAPGPLSDSLAAAVEQLRERGFRSLIAHPERHLTADVDRRLAALFERGALVQATAAYLTAESTAPTMLELAGRGLIHVLSSDSHSARRGRPLRISHGIAALRTVESLAPHLEWIAKTAPAAIARGLEVDAPFAPRPA